MKPARVFPSQPETKTLRISVHTSKEHEIDGRDMLFLCMYNRPTIALF
jgi:hypothetical protein